MRKILILLIACFALAPHAARAQSGDPGDLFVNAYMAVQAGEKLEQTGKLKDATSKYRYAAQVLDQISAKYPQWQPVVIEYRKKRTAEALTRLQDRIAKVGGGKSEDILPSRNEAVMPPTGSETGPLFTAPEDVLPPTPPPSRQASRTSLDRRPPEPDLPASNPLREIEDRLSKLQRELEKARSDAEKAQRENAELARQLEKATKAREDSDKKREMLQQRADSAENALLQATNAGKANTEQGKQLAAELAEVRKQQRQLKLEADAEAEFRQQLGDRVRAAQAKIARLSEESATARAASADTPVRISEIQKQLDEARKEKNDLVTKLSKTVTDLKSAVAQRDDALAQVAKMKDAQKQVDKLIADNAALMAKLGDAEKSILQFKAEGSKKDEELVELRKETTSLKTQLAQAQKEGIDYQRQMADLQQKLSLANSQIAQMKTDTTKSLAERNRLQEENLILRGVVLRQQKAEAGRAVAKKVVLGELAKLESKSKVLMDQIEYLSGPVVKLTEKERSLFKKPELQISDAEISLTAARKEGQSVTVEPPLPQPEIETALPAPAKAAVETPEVKIDEPKTAAEARSPGLVKPGATPEVKPAAGVKPGATPEMQLSTVLPKATPKTGATAPATAKGPEASPSVATKAPEPAKAAAPPAPIANAPGTASSKPALSLETGVKAPRELASLKQPFSSFPDGLTPPEKTPEKAPALDDLPTKTPPAPVEKPATTGEAPLSAASAGTGNTSSAVMNLPADLVPLAREGKDQFEKGNYREAERVYERVLTKAPSNLYTLSNLGVVYFRSGKFKRAEEMFKKAIAIAPEDGFSHCTLGIVFYSQQKYDEAVNELTKALAINNKNATAHNYLGITASQKGWQEAAQKELETATTLDPTYADAHFNLAVVFATQQPPNKENARKYYRRATELGAEPDSALEQLIK
jgi:Flp pilus assembly protein TadD